VKHLNETSVPLFSPTRSCWCSLEDVSIVKIGVILCHVDRLSGPEHLVGFVIVAFRLLGLWFAACITIRFVFADLFSIKGKGRVLFVMLVVLPTTTMR
jgi:hypothetical protein